MNASAPSGAAAAGLAKLRYAGCDERCYRRLRHGSGHRFVDDEGRPLRDAQELRRIAKLVIPPAWSDVRIAVDPRAHLQATGRDARGRKQYRYHPAWRRVRDAGKFARLVAFAEALPVVRRRVAADLRQHGLPRTKVLATIVRLLEATLIRVGNDEYARQNGSYGLTTLRNRHVAISAGTLQFEFRAKSGKMVSLTLADRRLARIVRACRDLPGQHLFQYLDDDGNRHSVGSGDVNDYLRTATGEDFTAKDFRTWAGTVLAAAYLLDDAAAAADDDRQIVVSRVVKRVATCLGNTPAVCRSSYIHPAIIEGGTSGAVVTRLRRRIASRPAVDETALNSCEAAVHGFLAALPAPRIAG